MSELQDGVQRAVVAKLITDEARTLVDKAELCDTMGSLGARTVDAVGPDGTVYGTVSRSNGRASARVHDREAFFLWVLERHPERLIRIIDPTWEENLLKMAAKLGDPVEAGTGEAIPGVVVERGDPYVSVRASEDGRDLMRRLFQPATLFALAAAEQTRDG